MRPLKTAAAVIAATTALTTKASAEICLLVVCLGGGGGTNPDPGPNAAPEIDVAQGFAALAILACALLILRERFMRQRAPR